MKFIDGAMTLISVYDHVIYKADEIDVQIEDSLYEDGKFIVVNTKCNYDTYGKVDKIFINKLLKTIEIFLCGRFVTIDLRKLVNGSDITIWSTRDDLNNFVGFKIIIYYDTDKFGKL